jgi:hypothetical protein
MIEQIRRNWSFEEGKSRYRSIIPEHPTLQFTKTITAQIICIFVPLEAGLHNCCALKAPTTQIIAVFVQMEDKAQALNTYSESDLVKEQLIIRIVPRSMKNLSKQVKPHIILLCQT